MKPRIITAAERAARKTDKTRLSTKITGAGDAFAIIAQPIAKAIDSVVGSNIANCKPCKKRRSKWNKAIPFITPPPAA